MDRFDFIGLANLAVGCAFLVSALRIYLARKKFLATAQNATGTVIEIRKQYFGRNTISIPLLEFPVPENRAHRAESWMGSGFGGFTVGQTVPVRYDPANPSRAEVDTFAVMWGRALLRAGYALFFLGLGAVLLFILG